MATSKCPSCEKTRFELKENSPTGSKFKFNFIQCSACGTVVGVADYFHIPTLIHGLQETVEKIPSPHSDLQTINYNIGQLAKTLTAIYKDLQAVKKELNIKG